ncbi:hypothetical protein mvi_20390 [Methylobacterium indicum]|uniref:Uncharacterized protein n=1 Tax=Methylobacterium indicum TaxID=1775910 RepID=A0A8H8WSP9_9HYPH|nr:hypothetical protein mvi_20390 [Methylobacterium indicum]
MAGYRSIPVIVRPSDLRARTVPADVAQAVRDGRARYVGFEGQGDPAALLARRLATMAPTASRPLSEMTGRTVAADEVDADAWVPGDRRGVGSRVLPGGGPERQVSRFRASADPRPEIGVRTRFAGSHR